MENLDVGSRRTLDGEAAELRATDVLTACPLSASSFRASPLSSPRAQSPVLVQPSVGDIVSRHFEGHLVEDGSTGPPGSKIIPMGRVIINSDSTRRRLYSPRFLSRAGTSCLGRQGLAASAGVPTTVSKVVRVPLGARIIRLREHVRVMGVGSARPLTSPTVAKSVGLEVKAESSSDHCSVTQQRVGRVSRDGVQLHTRKLWIPVKTSPGCCEGSLQGIQVDKGRLL